MSDLPQPVMEAGLLFRRGDVQQDTQTRLEIINWGFAQIDAEYPEDPLRAPLNVIRRLRARQEWERVIRTAGKDLRGVIANLDVKEMEFQLERRRINILAEDADQRSREATVFTSRVAIGSHQVTSRIDLNNQKELLSHQHELEQNKEDRASQRRIDEMRVALEGDISRILNEAAAKAMHTPSINDLLDLVEHINAKIQTIRSNPDLTSDDKHVQIKNLLDNLPAMIYQATHRER